MGVRSDMRGRARVRETTLFVQPFFIHGAPEAHDSYPAVRCERQTIGSLSPKRVLPSPPFRALYRKYTTDEGQGPCFFFGKKKYQKETFRRETAFRWGSV